MEPLPVIDWSCTRDPGVRFRHVELEINTACDLACFGCDRMSDVTTAPNMTLKQVRLFVDESIDLGWEWRRVRFLGGEPTLHPQFPELVGELIRYRKWFPGAFLQVLTNGLGKSEKYQEWLAFEGISLHAERKQKGVNPVWFNNTRIVPIDRYGEDIADLPPCGIFDVDGCGIGLTRHGYFLDGAGATVARVAGHDIGVMALRDVTWQAMLDQAKVLCRICGHWNPMTGPLVTKKVTETGTVTGRFWTEALARWRERKPVLRVYGEDG